MGEITAEEAIDSEDRTRQLRLFHAPAGPPEKLSALARLYGVDEVLLGAAAAA